MLSLQKTRSVPLCAVLAALAFICAGSLAAGRSAQDRDSPPQRQQEDEGEEAGRRRAVRIVLPYSELADLTPKQQETIREIRREIVAKRDELDREERERIMAVLTDSQRARVAEIEAERAAREADARDRARQNREQQQGQDGGGDS